MKAVYVMCDGSSRKIGISHRPKDRRSQLQGLHDCPISIVKEFWMKDHALASRVEIMAHALAGNPVIGKEWFDISAQEACEAVVHAMEILSADECAAPNLPKMSDAQKRALEKQKAKGLAEGTCIVSVRLNEPTRKAIKSRAAMSFQTIPQFLEGLINQKYEELYPSV